MIIKTKSVSERFVEYVELHERARIAKRSIEEQRELERVEAAEIQKIFDEASEEKPERLNMAHQVVTRDQEWKQS